MFGLTVWGHRPHGTKVGASCPHCPSRFQSILYNTRPAGEAESAPSYFFQNNSKTVADIDTKFGVPYLTSIWHRMTKFGWNQSDFSEKLTFLWGHFTPILTKIGSMLRNSPKIEFWSKPYKKANIDVKWHALQNDYLVISKLWVFDPQNFEKPIFLGENLYVGAGGTFYIIDRQKTLNLLYCSHR